MNNFIYLDNVDTVSPNVTQAPTALRHSDFCKEMWHIFLSSLHADESDELDFTTDESYS